MCFPLNPQKVIHFLQVVAATKALALFWAMPEAQVPRSVISFSAIISACEKGSQWQQALALSLPQTWLHFFFFAFWGFPLFSTHRAKQIICLLGSWFQPRFDAMPEATVQPNVVSFGAAISACEKGGQWQLALSLFRAIPEATMQEKAVCCSAAISACEKGKQWQQAVALFYAMPAEELADEISFSAVISACERAGQWQQVVALFQAMSEAKLES